MAGLTLPRGAISKIVLTRGAGGRMTLENLRRLACEIEAASAADTGAIVVSGPPGTFCAGGDLASFLACGSFDELSAVVRRFFLTLVDAEKPLIAAVDGEAIGLGMTMLLQFDAVFATPESRFVAPFADLGLTPEAGSTLLAPSRFGYLRAFEMLCMGRSLSAVEAYAFGLVSEVTVSGGAEARAEDVAHRLARKPRAALQATRRLLRGERSTLANRIDAELLHFRSQLEDEPTARRLTKLSRRGTQQAFAA